MQIILMVRLSGSRSIALLIIVALQIWIQSALCPNVVGRPLSIAAFTKKACPCDLLHFCGIKAICMHDCLLIGQGNMTWIEGRPSPDPDELSLMIVLLVEGFPSLPTKVVFIFGASNVQLDNILCTKDKHNFWRKILIPQSKGRGLPIMPTKALICSLKA